MIIRKASLFTIIFLNLLGLFAFPAYSQGFLPSSPNGDIEDWVVIEGSYAAIFVDRGIDLREAVKRIDVDFARFDPVEKELFLDKGSSDDERLANKIDIIIRKARKILDMHPQNLYVNIELYKSNQDLWNTYEDIFKERKEYKAFYIHKFRTVYISLDNLSESVLAHEIGHSIIDTYFAIIPPEKIRELLACYVDVHLKD